MSGWLERNRLGARLVVASLLVSSVLSVFAAGVQLLSSYSRQRDEAIARFELVTIAVLQPLEQALWTFDLSQVDLILDGIMTNSSASYLHLSTPTGHEWVRGDRHEAPATRVFELEHRLDDGRMDAVGTLTLDLSLQPVIDSIRAQFWTLLASNLVKAYLGAIALLLIFQWMVTRHLRQIASHVERSEPVSDAVPLALDRRQTPARDELDKITDAVTRYEDKVRSSVDQMQNEIRERKRAEADAKTALSVRTSFLGTMSHEVRTPLNSLLGLLHLIESGEDVPAKYREYARVGTLAGHQLLDQLVNVLEMARLDSAGGDVTLRDTDIRPLATLWLETARGSMALVGKDIEVSLDLDLSGGPIVRIDGPKVTQIVSNLVANAIKFTDKGEIAIAVASRVSGGLEVRVSDTGRGIPEADRERVFERFVQLDNSLRRDGAGSGLGLSICRELSVLMNATLTIREPETSRFKTEFVLKV